MMTLSAERRKEERECREKRAWRNAEVDRETGADLFNGSERGDQNWLTGRRPPENRNPPEREPPKPIVNPRNPVCAFNPPSDAHPERRSHSKQRENEMMPHEVRGDNAGTRERARVQ